MRTVLRTLAVSVTLGIAAALSVVFFGLYNTSARMGHLPGVSWILHTTFKNSVELRAPDPAEVPELTEAMARLGARHFDTACRVCHAAPGDTRSATIRSMLPEPPRIEEAVADWQPNELGWIVREGVKMSGMPGWPSARDDEMWQVVAFLTRVGGMDAATYAALTDTPRMAGPEGIGYCAGCHGSNGVSGNPHIPRLDIQSEEYLAMALRSYASGARESGIMAHAVSLVPEATLMKYAAFYAATGPAETEQPAQDPELVEAGQRLATAAGGDRDVPACISCHGPNAQPKREDVPELAGQYEPYLRTQLRLWRDGSRGGGPRANLMRQAATELSDQEIAALAGYYSSLDERGIDKQ